MTREKVGGMKVLFLTTGRFTSIQQHGIYPDLLRTFMNSGHEVYIVSTREKRDGLPTELVEEGKSKHLLVKIGNLTKTSLIEKGISTVLIEQQFKTAIKKYYANIKFDLVMYSTPPITLVSIISYIKKRDGAKSYLLLKDIFPQNAVDLGMMKKNGFKGLIYKFFRNKEKKLYALSDYIGCMSPANVDYVRKHNPEIKPETVEVCPNSIEIVDMRIELTLRQEIRKKYDLPLDKRIFLYGGNLGKPQGIPFLIECLRSEIKNKDAFFLIVGDGTEFRRLEEFFDVTQPSNMKLLKQLPKQDYDRMVAACDVGMIFLDHRFTIPNFPSRLLPLLQAGIPILACTDPNTDIGKICESEGFGWWCESNDVKKFTRCVAKACKVDLRAMGTKGYQCLVDNYSVEESYLTIVRHIMGRTNHESFDN